MQTQSIINLFTFLPDDIIREICCEWDTSYRQIFCTEIFRQELHNKKWLTTIVKEYCADRILDQLNNIIRSYSHGYQKKWGTDWSLISINHGKCYNALTREIIDLKTDVDFIWLVYEDYLLWKIVPKTYKATPFRQKYCKNIYYDGFFASTVKNTSCNVDTNKLQWGYNSPNILSHACPSRLVIINDNVHSFIHAMWY